MYGKNGVGVGIIFENYRKYLDGVSLRTASSLHQISAKGELKWGLKEGDARHETGFCQN